MSGTYLYTVTANTPVGLLTSQVSFGFRQPGGAPASEPVPLVLATPPSATGLLSPPPPATAVLATQEPVTGLLSPPPPATAVLATPTPATGLLSAPAETVAPTSSRFRLVALGFKALAQSKDINDARDGNGDEVYLTVIPNQTQLTGVPLPVTKTPEAAPLLMTRSYGDEAVSVPYGRIKAGSASPTGGVAAGDIVPASLDLAAPTGAVQSNQFPLLLWEGVLEDPTVVVIHTALWEDDVNPEVQALWVRTVYELAQGGYQSGPSAMGGGSSYTGQQIYGYAVAQKNSWGFQVEGLEGDSLFECTISSVNLARRPCEAHGVDRPFGTQGSGGGAVAPWQDRFFVLTRAVAEDAVARPVYLLATGGNATSMTSATLGTFIIRLIDTYSTGLTEDR